MSTPSPVILEADGIGKSFGQRTILSSAGLTVRAGHITALMGRNGVGKSTLFKIVAGTIKPDHGSVRINGQWVGRKSLARRARAGLMYSAQDSALTSQFTLRSHFLAFTQVYGEREGLDDLWERLRLTDLLDRRPIELSGGERQRASLGLAILRSPTCLLMDEPFAGVAPVDIPLISDALLELRNGGVGIAVSGHNVFEIFSISDEIIWMVGGTTHWLGRPDEAEAHFQFRMEYLGPRVGLRTMATERPDGSCKG